MKNIETNLSKTFLDDKCIVLTLLEYCASKSIVSIYTSEMVKIYFYKIYSLRIIKKIKTSASILSKN